jgi:starch-binding outer membrane protein, SusD/RagB family
VQLLVTGVFTATRIDAGYLSAAASSFARDFCNFTNSDDRFLTMWCGDGLQISDNTFYGTGGWPNVFRAARSANLVLSALPTVSPAYSAADQAAIAGVLYTMKALNFMNLAEYRDTLGVPIGDLTNTNINNPAPILCNPDVWSYIVALLDSGNADLNTGGAAMPLTLPGGFAAVSMLAGPSTTAGSFAAFNRALAGKANLELAYAIARNSPSTSPTPTTPGTPDPTALARADSAIAASALYNPAALVPPVAGEFSDPNIVAHSFSGSSGDLPNPYTVGEITTNTVRVMNDFLNQVDTSDLRWKNKFYLDPYTAQQTAFDSASGNYLVNFYGSVTSVVPIIRNEGLVLDRAQVQLGLGNFAAAATQINYVHMTVGGHATLAVIPATYTGTRDSLLAEERISMVLEGSGDRMISLRMYGLAATADTTWGSSDMHTTVIPIPFQEASSRNNVLTRSCP